MGKSMNLNNLTPEEAQKILEVIQKDFELRQKEKERLGKIEEVVTEEETKTELLTRQKNFTENCCIRCCQTFGFIFNRKTTCQICKLYVCKSCCVYDDSKKAYNCKACLTQGELKQKSCEWFYDHVSARFKRFGSAKVVRTLYKQADGSRNKFHCSEGEETILEEPEDVADHADNESDSGYDPSLYSSFGQSGSIRVKSRPALTAVFPEIHISDENGQELDNGLIPPPLMAPVSPGNSTNNSFQSTDTSLEQIQMSPTSQTPPSPSPRMLTTPTQTNQELDNNQNVEKTDIYKEAFENSKRTEEAKFKIRFDNLVTEMQQALESISPRDGSVPAGYGTSSYGETITTYKQRVKDMLVSLSQRLELAVESFDETCSNSPSLTSQKVRQIINKLVEDRLGESLDLTSDEAVSDLSSLSDDSCEHKSYEDQVAQTVIARVLELYRTLTGVTLNLDEPMDQRQSDSSGVEEKLVDKTMDSSVGEDTVIDTAEKGIGTGKVTVDTGVEAANFDRVRPASVSTGTGVDTADIEEEQNFGKTRKASKTKGAKSKAGGGKRARRSSDSGDQDEEVFDEDYDDDEVSDFADVDEVHERRRTKGAQGRGDENRGGRSAKKADEFWIGLDDDEDDDEEEEEDGEENRGTRGSKGRKGGKRTGRSSRNADQFDDVDDDDDNDDDEVMDRSGKKGAKGRRSGPRTGRSSQSAEEFDDEDEEVDEGEGNARRGAKGVKGRKGGKNTGRSSRPAGEFDEDDDDYDEVSRGEGDRVKARRAGKLETNRNNQRNGHRTDRSVRQSNGNDRVDGYSDSGDDDGMYDEDNIDYDDDDDRPKGSHKTKGRSRVQEGDDSSRSKPVAPKRRSKDSKNTSSDSENGAQHDRSNKSRQRLGTYNLEDDEDGEQAEHEPSKVKEKELLQNEFEKLRTFARDINPRPLYEKTFEEQIEPETEEDEIEAVHVDHEESQSDFESRVFTFDKLNATEDRSLPDFSDLDFEYHDFGFEEVDPDLLSMNLCPILEETEEELEDDKEDVTNYEQDWKGNWIFQGAGGINPYSSLSNKSKPTADFGDVNIMVPEPKEDWVPQVGEANIDDVSDMSENEDREDSLDNLSDEEHSFYAKTSEEIARITRKSNHIERAALFNTTTATEGDTESSDSAPSRPMSSFSDSGVKTTQNEGSSFDSRFSEKSQPPKLSEDLVPSETGDPKFEIPPLSVNIPEGEPAKLTCRVSGTQPMDVFWYKVRHEELEELENSENFEVVHDGSRHHLTMYNMTSGDAGQYMCMLMNEKGRCCQYFILSTKKNTQELKAPEFLKTPSDVEVTEGQSVKFRCKVKGYPQPRVIWYKDGRILLNDLNYKFERFGNRDYILAIDTVTMDEDAEYSVLAKNIAGEVKSSSQLIVEPKTKPESVSKPKAAKVTTKVTAAADEPEKTTNSSGLIDLSYLRKGRAPDSSVGKAGDSSVGRKTKSTSEKKEEQNLTNLGKKYTMTKDSVTAVAEDMLSSTKELTEIDRSIAAMDKLLEDLDQDMSSSLCSDVDLDPSNDLTCVATLDNYAVLQTAAENVRNATSATLDYLNKTDTVAKGRQPIDDFATSTPRSSESERPFNPDNDTSHIPPCDNEVTMETTKTDDVPMETLDTSEDSHKSEVVFSVTPLTINMDTTKGKSQKPVSSRLGSSSSDSKNRSDSESDKPSSDVNAPAQSEDWFDISDIQNTSNTTTGSASSSTEQNKTEPSQVVNLGPKRENKLPYERDFYITNTPQMARKTPPTSPRGTTPPTSPREEQQRAHTEEKIYLAANNVYNLENKVQSLADKMRAVNNVQSQDKLENQVAKTVAEVARSESQVKDIEKSVDQLKKASSAQSEPKKTVAGSTKAKQAPKAPQTIVTPPKERPEPTYLKGSTNEEDLPESRAEYNDEDGTLELPSVNRLKAMFGGGGGGGAKSDSSIKRDSYDFLDEPVHSITARSVPKSQLEKLKATASDDPHSRVALNQSSNQSYNQSANQSTLNQSANPPATTPVNPGRATSITTGQQIKQTPNAPKQVYQSDKVEKSHQIPAQSMQISSNVKQSDSNSGNSKQSVQIHLSADSTNRPVSPVTLVQSGTPKQKSKPIKSAVSGEPSSLQQTPVQSKSATQDGRTGNEIDTPEERKSPKIKSGAISAMSKFWEKVNQGDKKDPAPEILEYE